MAEVVAISKSLNIKDEAQIQVILQFYHDLGDIVYFNEPHLQDLVILDPQWLVDIFKSVITVKQYQHQDPHCRKYLDKLDQEGILNVHLVDFLWDKSNLQEHN